MGSQKADDSRATPRPEEVAPTVPPGSDVQRAAEHPQPLPSDGGAMLVEEDAVLTVESLIRDHHAPLYRYAYRLAGTHSDAEDLVQQAFLIACRKLDQVREPEHVSAWLYAVLRSCFLKSRRKVHPQPAGTLELNLDQMPDQAVAPEGIDRDELQAALNELPDDYKLVVVMFYFEHYTYKQIADQLDLPIGTVMSRLARAKQRLRSRLASEQPTAVRLPERTAPVAPNAGPTRTTPTPR